MNFTKFFALIALAFSTASVFADAANLLVAFETKSDTYADGTPVKDGEWYALCWSKDGVFEGLNLDCTPVDKNDRVCIVASLAKGGKCPYTVFQIDSKSENFKTSGKYAVVLLDTRDVNGAVATKKPTAVNAAATAKEYTAGDAKSGATEQASAGTAAWAESKIDTSSEDFKPAKIKSFKVIDDAKIEIEVENMLPGVKYNIKMGKTVDTIKDYALDVPVDASTEGAKIIIDKGDAQYFQLSRNPLKK